MTYPRHSQVSLRATPYYHVVARCVRRSWLWGFDAYAGRDFSHRKAWVLERLQTLCQVFTIDICAYAIMANHYHLVLRVDQHQAESLTPEEVVARWSILFSTTELIRRWQSTPITPAEQEAVAETIALWRARLHDLSWMMRALNEHLARRANAEDECKGRFWEGRFKSQALLDEAGLLTAMAYVDLNPIRAGIAEIPEESEFTSIYERIRAFQNARPESASEQSSSSVGPDNREGQGADAQPKVPLLPFKDQAAPGRKAIPYALKDYLELVDWTGRNIAKPNKASIGRHRPPILTRLKIDAGPWVSTMQPSGNVYSRAIGSFKRMRSHAWNIGQQWIRGVKLSKRAFGTE